MSEFEQINSERENCTVGDVFHLDDLRILLCAENSAFDFLACGAHPSSN